MTSLTTSRNHTKTYLPQQWAHFNENGTLHPKNCYNLNFQDVLFKGHSPDDLETKILEEAQLENIYKLVDSNISQFNDKLIFITFLHTLNLLNCMGKNPQAHFVLSYQATIKKLINYTSHNIDTLSLKTIGGLLKITQFLSLFPCFTSNLLDGLPLKLAQAFHQKIASADAASIVLLVQYLNEIRLKDIKVRDKLTLISIEIIQRCLELDDVFNLFEMNSILWLIQKQNIPELEKLLHKWQPYITLKIQSNRHLSLSHLPIISLIAHSYEKNACLDKSFFTLLAKTANECFETRKYYVDLSSTLIFLCQAFSKAKSIWKTEKIFEKLLEHILKAFHGLGNVSQAYILIGFETRGEFYRLFLNTFKVQVKENITKFSLDQLSICLIAFSMSDQYDNEIIQEFISLIKAKKSELNLKNISNISTAVSRMEYKDKELFDILYNKACELASPVSRYNEKILLAFTKIGERHKEFSCSTHDLRRLIYASHTKKSDVLPPQKSPTLEPFIPTKLMADLIDSLLKAYKIIDDRGNLLPPYNAIPLKPLGEKAWKRYIQALVEKINFENPTGDTSSTTLSELLLFMLEYSKDSLLFEDVLTIGGFTCKKVLREDNFEYIKEFLRPFKKGLEEYINDAYIEEEGEEECDHDLRILFPNSSMENISTNSQLLSQRLDLTLKTPPKAKPHTPGDFVKRTTILPSTSKTGKVINSNALVINQLSGHLQHSPSTQTHPPSAQKNIDKNATNSPPRKIDISVVSLLSRHYLDNSICLSAKDTLAALRRFHLTKIESDNTKTFVVCQSLVEKLRYEDAPKITPKGLGKGDPRKSLIMHITKTSYIDNVAEVDKYAWATSIVKCVQGTKDGTPNDRKIELGTFLKGIENKSHNEKVNEIINMLDKKMGEHLIGTDTRAEISFCIYYMACQSLLEHPVSELANSVWQQKMASLSYAKNLHSLLKITLELSQNHIPFTYIKAFFELQLYCIACQTDKDLPVSRMEIVLTKDQTQPAYQFRIKKDKNIFRIFAPITPQEALETLVEKDDLVKHIKLKKLLDQPIIIQSNNSEILHYLPSLPFSPELFFHRLCPLNKRKLSDLFFQIKISVETCTVSLLNTSGTSSQLYLKDFLNSLIIYINHASQEHITRSFCYLLGDKNSGVSLAKEIAFQPKDVIIKKFYNYLLNSKSGKPYDFLLKGYLIKNSFRLEPKHCKDISKILFSAFLSSSWDTSYDIYVYQQENSFLTTIEIFENGLRLLTNAPVRKIGNIVTILSDTLKRLIKESSLKENDIKRIFNSFIRNCLKNEQLTLATKTYSDFEDILSLKPQLKCFYLISLLTHIQQDEVWQTHCKKLLDLLSQDTVPIVFPFILKYLQNNDLDKEHKQKFVSMLEGHLNIFLDQKDTIDLPRFMALLYGYIELQHYMSLVKKVLLSAFESGQEMTDDIVYLISLFDNISDIEYAQLLIKYLTVQLVKKNDEAVLSWLPVIKSSLLYVNFFVEHNDKLTALILSQENVTEDLFMIALEGIYFENTLCSNTRVAWTTFIEKCIKTKQLCFGTQTILRLHDKNALTVKKLENYASKLISIPPQTAEEQLFTLLLLEKFNINEELIWTTALTKQEVTKPLDPVYTKRIKAILANNFYKIFNQQESPLMCCQAFEAFAYFCVTHFENGKTVFRDELSLLKSNMESIITAYDKYKLIKSLLYMEYKSESALIHRLYDAVCVFERDI